MRKNLKIILMVLLIYFFAFGIGFFISNNVFKMTLEYNPMDIKEVHMNSNTMWHIFFNNLKVYFILLSGFFLLKIPTVINLLSNGSMLGFVVAGIPAEDSIKPLFSLAIHGVPELCAFFIAAYLVFKGKTEFNSNIKKSITLLFLGCFLVLIASLIETYISPLVII